MGTPLLATRGQRCLAELGDLQLLSVQQGGEKARRPAPPPEDHGLRNPNTRRFSLITSRIAATPSVRSSVCARSTWSGVNPAEASWSSAAVLLPLARRARSRACAAALADRAKRAA